MLNVDSHFKSAIKSQASDLHLVGGELPMIRVKGALTETDSKPLSNKELLSAVMGMLSAEQQAHYKQEQELDFGYELDGVYISKPKKLVSPLVLSQKKFPGRRNSVLSQFYLNCQSCLMVWFW